jgi:hypothetical protein
LTSLISAGYDLPVFRRPLAVLLTISLTILAGLDVFEDLDPPSILEFGRSTAPPAPAAAPTGNLANNIVESAANLKPNPSDVLNQPIVEQQAIEVPPAVQKVSKLHKLKRVFLI